MGSEIEGRETPSEEGRSRGATSEGAPSEEQRSEGATSEGAPAQALAAKGGSLLSIERKVMRERAFGEAQRNEAPRQVPASDFGCFFCACGIAGYLSPPRAGRGAASCPAGPPRAP